jgi:hypothetical protein
VLESLHFNLRLLTAMPQNFFVSLTQ